jgi:dolichol-phosphate mannosyltransferase
MSPDSPLQGPATEAEGGTASPRLSVVAPVFNEERIVPDLVRRITEACRRLSEPFEILMVDDGSRDGTLLELAGLSRSIPELRVICLFRNFGHMSALSAGILLAKGDAVLVMDGDLQDPPELIGQFYDEWKGGADVVYGLRIARKERLMVRWATSLFYFILGKLSDTPIPRQAGTFCLMDRVVVDFLRAMPERSRFFAGLRAWIGGRQSFVKYERPDRPHGQSQVGMRGLFRLARTALISFSKVPLRYASLLSLSCGLVLFLVGSTAIGIRMFTNLAIPGWATYTTLFGMTGFVQSLVLAALSEYVAVIFDEVKNRPLFLVREEIVQGKAVRGSRREG